MGLFKKVGREGRNEEDIRPGGVYRSMSNNGLVQTAKVLSISQDSWGIRHVSYELTVEKSSDIRFEAVRTLSLGSFRSLFTSAVKV